MKTSGRKLWIILLSIALTLTCAGCGFLFGSDEPAAKEEPMITNEEVEEIPTQVTEDMTESDDFAYVPVYEFTGTGNFTDIDQSVWSDSSYAPEDIVGKWYEDGFTNGYYLEIYGDGTWQLFADKVVNGYYEVWSNGVIDFTEAKYGVSFGQADIGNAEDYDKGFSGYILNFTIYANSLVKTRTPESPVCFQRTKDSAPCDDLVSFYREAYPFIDFCGYWYQTGEEQAMNFFEILGSGNWGEEQDGQGMLEVGILEKVADGKFTSVGGNSGAEYTFEYPGDGYLYINGTQYERREGVDLRYQYIVDKWFYYDVENDCYTDTGYEFFDDLTYCSLPGNSVEEQGTYFYVDDYLLLYDNNGNRLHRFYQNIYSARGKMMMDENNENLYGEGPGIE